MPTPTQYSRLGLFDNRSLGEAIEYVRNNSENYLSWKEYINRLVERNGGTYPRFAAKTGFSKNTVKKWCIEGKKPQNRDSFIKLAFGLNMNLEQTNHLLSKYGSYAELYPKDLYDAIIIYVINRRQNDFDNPAYGFDSIQRFNDRLAHIREEAYQQYKERQARLRLGQTLNTMFVQQNLLNLKDDADFERYILGNKEIFFNTYDKLIAFIDDFIGIRSVEYSYIHDEIDEKFSLHALCQKKHLNKSFEEALSQLRTKRILPKRAQLITIGILLNMVEYDINQMLELANMRKLYPRDRVDALMIFLLASAVDENPDLEYYNAVSYLSNGTNLRLRQQYRQAVERYYNSSYAAQNPDLDDIFEYIRSQSQETGDFGEFAEVFKEFIG